MLLPCDARRSGEAGGGPWRRWRWRRWRPPGDGSRRRGRCPAGEANGSAIACTDGTSRTDNEPAAGADGPSDAVPAAADARQRRSSPASADPALAWARGSAGPRRTASSHDPTVSSHDPTVAGHGWHSRRHAATGVPTAERGSRSAKSGPTVSPERCRQADRSFAPVTGRPDDQAFVSDATRCWRDSAARRWHSHQARTRIWRSRRRRSGRTDPPVAVARCRQPPRRRFCHASLAILAAG